MLTKRVFEAIAIIIINIIVFICGSRFSRWYEFKEKKWIEVLNVICLLGVCVSQYWNISYVQWIFLVISLLGMGQLFRFGWKNEKISIKLVKISGILLIFQMIVVLLLSYESIFYIFSSRTVFVKMKNIWLILLIWSIIILLADFFAVSNENNDHVQRYSKAIYGYILSGTFFLILFCWLVRIYGLKIDETIYQAYVYCITNPISLVNIFAVSLITFLLVSLVGYRIGNVISNILLLSVFVANLIKIKFHSTFFSWLDLLQIKEMFWIGREFFSDATWNLFKILLIFCLVLLIFLAKKNWKRLIQIIHFKCRPIAFIFSLLLLIVFNKWLSRQSDKTESGIYLRTWENKSVNVSCNGLFVNLMLDFTNLADVKLAKPENYSQQEAETLLEQFEAITVIKDENVNPDVIMIMAESYFDVSEVPGIDYNTVINSSIEKYSNNMKMISQRFGGYTSAIEFEALTGMSLAFLPDSLTPYTTYFNSTSNTFPSIVDNFNQAGYHTQVIHPDLAQFYNRDVVYAAMGFDEYQSIESFHNVPENMLTENGWVKDEYMAQHIIEELEQKNEPQFIFAITMEEHYVTVDKYSETEIKIINSDLDEAVKYEFEQTGQAYYNTDKMIAQIINYLGSTDRPTLLYIFGDHLPPNSYLGESGYILETDNKYGTAYIQYSNYKELPVIAEKFTPNQIAAAVVQHANIKHYSYFDYIYKLREKYPVLHKEYVNIEEDAFDIYKFIQYDVMFGERYLCK